MTASARDRTRLGRSTDEVQRSRSLTLDSGEAIELRSPDAQAIIESLSGAGVQVVSA
ncbi:hypothetical protein GCM10023080_060010 [Streptomyces pseudoechinosporeus]